LNNKKSVALIFISGLVIFLAGLHVQEFIRINCRFAIFVMEMKKYGVHVFPTLYDKAYTDYPSTLIYLMYLASLGGRVVNMLTITIPTALAAVLTLIMTYLLGARISKWLGAYSVLLCLLSYEFVSIARAPSLDMFVALATVTSFYLIYTADQDKGWKRLLLVPLCLIGSFAIRGPIGIVIPAAVVFSYYVINRKWTMSAVTAVISGVLIFLCMGTLLYLCVYSGGKELLELFLQDQIFSRMGSCKPPWYFFTNAVGSYAVTYPLALLVIAFYVKKLIKKPSKDDSKELHLLRSLVAWMFIVLIGMSIPGTKHLRYIVPIIPAMALVASWIFLNFDNLEWFKKLKKLVFLLCKIAPFGALAFIIVGTIVIKIIGLDIKLPFFIPVMLFAVLSAAVWALAKDIKPEQRDFALLGIMVAVLTLLRLMTIEPIEQYLEGSRKFVAEVEKVRQDNKVYFFNFGPDGDELKYQVNLGPDKMFVSEYIMAHGKYVQKAKPFARPAVKATPLKYTESQRKILDFLLKIFPPKKGVKFPKINPRFVLYQDYDKLLCLPEGTIFITREKRFKRNIPDELKPKFEIVVKGKMGHKECVAFRLKPQGKKSEK
jgi:4-amino-4-deoxy-L-arabinose transferase-like glycosyltransferase